MQTWLLLILSSSRLHRGCCVVYRTYFFFKQLFSLLLHSGSGLFCSECGVLCQMCFLFKPHLVTDTEGLGSFPSVWEGCVSTSAGRVSNGWGTKMGHWAILWVTYHPVAYLAHWLWTHFCWWRLTVKTWPLSSRGLINSISSQNSALITFSLKESIWLVLLVQSSAEQ